VTNDTRRARNAAAVTLLIVTLAGCGNGDAESTTSPTPATETILTSTTTFPAATTTAPTIAAAPVDVGTVVIAESGCSFEPSASPLSAGEVVFTIVNETEGQAGAHVWGPLADGYSFDDFVEYVEEEIALTMAGEPFIGPAAWFGPLIPSDNESSLFEGGETGEITGTADAGTFGIVCVMTLEEVGLRIYAYAGPFEVSETG